MTQESKMLNLLAALVKDFEMDWCDCCGGKMTNGPGHVNDCLIGKAKEIIAAHRRRNDSQSKRGAGSNAGP